MRISDWSSDVCSSDLVKLLDFELCATLLTVRTLASGGIFSLRIGILPFQVAFDNIIKDTGHLSHHVALPSGEERRQTRHLMEAGLGHDLRGKRFAALLYDGGELRDYPPFKLRKASLEWIHVGIRNHLPRLGGLLP